VSDPIRAMAAEIVSPYMQVVGGYSLVEAIHASKLLGEHYHPLLTDHAIRGQQAKDYRSHFYSWNVIDALKERLEAEVGDSIQLPVTVIHDGPKRVEEAK
jgi:hypothetical protein